MRVAASEKKWIRHKNENQRMDSEGVLSRTVQCDEADKKAKNFIFLGLGQETKDNLDKWAKDWFTYSVNQGHSKFRLNSKIFFWWKNHNN